jgi:hypothetical protein
MSELQTTDLFGPTGGPFGGILTLAAEAAERENSIRLELLARKYAQKDLPKEQMARLKIATERVRSLLPSVTPEDYDAVAVLIHAAQDAQAVNAAVRKTLGI